MALKTDVGNCSVCYPRLFL